MIEIKPRAGAYTVAFQETASIEDEKRKQSLIADLGDMRRLANVLRDKGHDSHYCERFIQILDDLQLAVNDSWHAYEAARLSNLPQFVAILPIVVGAEKPLAGDALLAAARSAIGERTDVVPPKRPVLNLGALDFEPEPTATQGALL